MNNEQDRIAKSKEVYKTEMRKTGMFVTVFLVVCLVAIFGFVAANNKTYDPDQWNSYSSSSTLSDDMKGALWALAEKAVKNELKAPATAKFPASYGSDGVSFGKSGDLYYVTAYVDAQNGFGATLRTGFTVYAKLDGTKMVLDHVDFDE